MRFKLLLPLLLSFSIKGFAQVTMQTGAPAVNIPLIGFQDQASSLDLDVSLSYVGGNGIKIDDKASEVGLGWILNAGGMVNRIRVGEPDDQYPITVSDKIHIPAGLFFQPQNPPPSTNAKLGWNPTYDERDKIYYDPNVHYDREHDQFIYSINGKAGKFVLSQGIGGVLEEELSGNLIHILTQPLQYDNAGAIYGVEIIDEKGIKYTFKNTVVTDIMHYSKGCYKNKFITNTGTGANYIGWQYVAAYSPRHSYIQDSYYMQPDDNNIEIYVPSPVGYKIADAWKISEIENPSTGDKIIFNYERKSFASKAGVFSSNGITDIFKSNGVTVDKTITSLLITEEYQSEEYAQLRSINLPDEKKIVFEYAQNRKDEIGRSALTEIQFFNANQLQYKFSLGYKYLYENTIVDDAAITSNVKNRDIALVLTSIIKSGGDGTTEPPMGFDYYKGLAGSSTLRFPKRNSFSKDHWGFYNGITNGVLNSNDQISPVALRDYTTNPQLYRSPASDVNIVQIGMLKSMTNKYGAKTEYSYELNRALSNNSEIFSGGLRVLEIKNYENASDFTAQKFIYKNDQGFCSADNYEIPQYHSYIDGKSWTPTGSRYKSYKSSVGSIVSQGMTTIRAVASFTKGLAIAEKSAALSGAVTGIPAFFSSLSLMFDFYQLLRLTGLFVRSTGTMQTFRTNTDASVMIFANNYIIPNYSVVSEYNYGIKEGAALNNGHSTYKFTSILDKPLLIPDPVFPYSNKQRKLSFLYNSPKSIQTYDMNGTLVSEKLFTYEDIILQTDNPAYTSLKVGPHTILSSPDDPAHDEYFENNSGEITPTMVWDYYNFYYGTSHLTETTDRKYSNGSFIESKTGYEYKPNSYLPRSIITKDSKKDITESKVYYTIDFETPWALTLGDKNIIVPMVTEIWKSKQGEPRKLFSTNVMEYGVLANGDYKPIKSFSLKTTTPLSESVIGQFNPFLPIRDASKITLDHEIQYDSKGNASQEKAIPGDNINSLMYNLDHQIIGTASNANRSEIAYTSFEEKAEIDGGFQLNMDDAAPHSLYSTELSPTGTRCIQLAYAEDQIVSLIPITKESVLSFWATTSNFRLIGIISSQFVTGPTINGWTYYELTIPAGSPQLQIIKGRKGVVKIDELRLYPANAKMKTTAYDLAGNKITECDINNRISYYESDKLGRPLKIMDEKRNVIKTFEYHFKN